ncbi:MULTISPECIES: YchJ family protein [unclassified Corynebacterium]|uniref:YchJ family protein n=1 Tax=unclassified Corynebacterium TaxID=2624378 RepID=UPI00286EFDD3|nr:MULTISPECIES: YchJ family metal-binding protein [unclassified Corynebacterium]
MSTLLPLQYCPCQSGLGFDDCCGPLIARHRKAPTAVALMRSRYTAFCVGDADYLIYSWDPLTAPPLVDIDPSISWTGLEVLSTTHGGLMDSNGLVHFKAHYTIAAAGHAPRHETLEELSVFRRFQGRWVYSSALK